MTPEPRTPVSRRERPAKPALTREGIVAVALEVMRSEGLERATMRRLAKELDTGPASLYVYFRNTSELYGAILDELLEGLDLTQSPPGGDADGAPRADGDWRGRLTRLLTSYLLILFDYPSLARAALVWRPTGPRYLSLFERVLALLGEGGVPGPRAAWAVDLLLQFATTSAAEHGSRSELVDADAEIDALAATLLAAPADTYPNISALGAELLSGPGTDRLAWGLDVLINGILHTPRP